MTYRRRFVTILTARLRSGIVISLVCCGTPILRFLKETTVNLCLCRKGKENLPNLIYFAGIENPPPVLEIATSPIKASYQKPQPPSAYINTCNAGYNLSK